MALVLVAATVVTLAGMSMVVRKTVPIDLDLVVWGLRFSVTGGEETLLSERVPFDRLVVEGCEAVVFPLVKIQSWRQASVEDVGAARFRCDPFEVGSKVTLHQDGPNATGPGNVERLTVPPGGSVRIETTTARPPAVRIEIAPGPPVNLTLRGGAPLALTAEFARLEGVELPAALADVTTYRVSPVSDLRVATVESAPDLKLVLTPGALTPPEQIFRATPDVPVTEVELLRWSDVIDGTESTVISGTLTYPSLPAIERAPLELDDFVELEDLTQFRLRTLALTRLEQLELDPPPPVSIDRDSLVVQVRFIGEASVVRVNGVGREVTLFEWLRTNPTVVVLALIAAAVFWSGWEIFIHFDARRSS